MQYCRRPSDATFRSCESWLNALLTEYDASQPDVQYSIATTYYFLSEITSDPDLKSEYRRSAFDVFTHILQLRPDEIRALYGLALHAQSDQEKISIYRDIVTIDPGDISNVRMLTRLLPTNTPEGQAEAGKLMEEVFHNTELTEVKLQAAASSAAYYRQAGDISDAERIANVASNFLNPEERVAQAVAVQNGSPTMLEDNLKLLCQGPSMNIIGMDHCIAGISNAIESISQTRSVESSGYVNAVASVINTFLQSNPPQTPENQWRDILRELIEEHLLSEDIATGHIYAVHSVLTYDERDVSLRSLETAVEMLPENGEYMARLGNAYIQLNRWEEAVEYLSRSIEHLPDYMHQPVREQIQLAQENASQKCIRSL